MSLILLDIFNAMPEESQKLFQEEIKKFQRFLDSDIKTMSPEQLSSLLSVLATEKSNLSVKIIQLETQLQSRQRELDVKMKEIQTKYGVADIGGLEKKKQDVERELEQHLLVLKQIVEKS